MMTPIPPFQPGEEVTRDVPDDLLQQIRGRIAADQQFEVLPCLWLDTEQQRCLHYELRPEACRKFEINSDLCRLSRWETDVDD
ncbi:MAG: hypothetical protein GY903_14145 [Fuerstiella sp.]|nr:hypothetical protein [Fuerstiella sp.]MCP4855628.1 hypothetical protein [Fuerstiella sp.]